MIDNLYPLKRLKYYFKIWSIMTKNAFLVTLTQRIGFIIFLTGKLLRFTFLISFIYFTVKGAKTLAGYNVDQALFFFITYTFIDTVSQFFFREVYRFRPLLISGDFDLVLVKPFNALFRVLMGGSDIIDLVTIPPLIFLLITFAHNLHPSLIHILLYIFLLINGLLIATSFHIFVIALGIITLEIDHTIMIYRDLTTLGRFPIDIYSSPLQFILTFFIPIGIMMTFPAKTLLGLVNPLMIVSAFILGVLFFTLSLNAWKFALRKYTSASS